MGRNKKGGERRKTTWLIIIKVTLMKKRKSLVSLTHNNAQKRISTYDGSTFLRQGEMRKTKQWPGLKSRRKRKMGKKRSCQRGDESDGPQAQS